jgi:hypothetical protein
MTATKTKRATKARPPKGEPTARKASTRATKRHQFVAGDEVEFYFREGQPRPQGDATIINVEPMANTKGDYMAMLDVCCVVIGEPDKLRNPDGELWASADELFKPGTREVNPDAMVENVATLQTDDGTVTIATDSPQVAAAIQEVASQHVISQPPIHLTVQQKQFMDRLKGTTPTSQPLTTQSVLSGTDTRVANSLKSKCLITVEHDTARLTEQGAVVLAQLMAAENKQPTAHGEQQVARVGDVVVRHDDAAAVTVTAGRTDQGTSPVVPITQRPGLVQAVQLLHNATGGRCDMIMLASRNHSITRARIAQSLKGQEPTPDDVTVSGLRFLFRAAMEIEESLRDEPADERIAALAVQLIESGSTEQTRAVAMQGPAVMEDSHAENNAAPEAAQPSSEPAAATAEHSNNQSAAKEDFMSRTAERIRGRRTGGKPAAKKRITSQGQSNRGRKPGGKLILGAYAGAPFIRFLHKQGLEYEAIQVILKGEGHDLPESYVRSKLTKEHNKDWPPAEVTPEHQKELKAKYKSAFKK